MEDCVELKEAAAALKAATEAHTAAFESAMERGEYETCPKLVRANIALRLATERYEHCRYDYIDDLMC